MEDAVIAISLKLFIVNFLTKKRGGYANSSSKGLNAVANIYTIGNTIMVAKGINTANIFI